MLQPENATAGPSLKYGVFLLTVTFLVYSQIMRFPFIGFDDTPYIVWGQSHMQWKTIPTYFLDTGSPAGSPEAIAAMYRPVTASWITLNSKLFGLHVWLWRLTSFSLYLLGIWLLWRLVWSFVQDGFVAFSAALIYALHPMHVEGIAWLSGATVEPLMAALFLGAFLAYMRWRDSGGTRRLVACVVLTLAALLSKETAVALPILIVSHALIFRRSENPEDRRIGLKWLIFSMTSTVLFYTALRIGAIRGAVSAGSPVHTWTEIVLTAPLLLVTYLKHALWPVGLATWYDVPIVHSITATRLYVPLAVCLIYGVLMVWSIVRKPLIGFLLLWGPVCLVAPVIGLRTFADSELLHDRFAFVALAGLCVLVACVVRLLPKRGPVLFGEPAAAVFAMAVLLIVLGTLTTKLAYTWRSDLAMYTRALEVCPRCIRPRVLVASELLRQGNANLAIALNLDTMRMAPDHWQSNLSYGLALNIIGDRQGALRVLTHGLEVNPGNVRLSIALAKVLAENENYAAAIKVLQQQIPKAGNPTLLERQILVIQEMQRNHEKQSLQRSNP